jgi:hypothetical protein
VLPRAEKVVDGKFRQDSAWHEPAAPDIARGGFTFAPEHHEMITCYLRYQVDPDKLADFEAYGAMWLDLMPRFGGIHHGYFLPSEGESDVALANSIARTPVWIRTFRRR